MMQMYETDDDYSLDEIKEFEDWFDETIGTEYERNESASGNENEFYLILCDLTRKEVDMCMQYENQIKKEKNANNNSEEIR